MITKVKTLVGEYNDLAMRNEKMSLIATKRMEIMREVGKTNADNRKAAVDRVCQAENPGLELCKQYSYPVVKVAEKAIDNNSKISSLEVKESIAAFSLFDFQNAGIFSPEWLDVIAELHGMFTKRAMLEIDPSVGINVIKLHFGPKGAEDFDDIPTSNRKIQAKLNEFSMAIVGPGYKFNRAYMGVLVKDFGKLSKRKHPKTIQDGDKTEVVAAFDLATTVFPNIRQFAGSLLNVLAGIVQEVPAGVQARVHTQAGQNVTIRYAYTDKGASADIVYTWKDLEKTKDIKVTESDKSKTTESKATDTTATATESNKDSAAPTPAESSTNPTNPATDTPAPTPAESKATEKGQA